MRAMATVFLLVAFAALGFGPAAAQNCEVTCVGVSGGAHTKTYCTRDLTPSRCEQHAQAIALREHMSCHSLWRDHCRFSGEPYRHSRPGGSR